MLTKKQTGTNTHPTIYLSSSLLCLSYLVTATLCSILLVQPSYAQQEIPTAQHVTATYNVYYHHMKIGKITRLFTLDHNGHFSLLNRSQASLALFKLDLQESVIGTFSHNAIQPYYYRRYSSKELTKDMASIQFNWKQPYACYQSNNSQPTCFAFTSHHATTGRPIASTAHHNTVTAETTPSSRNMMTVTNKIYDPLSYQLAIKQDLAQGKTLLNYTVINKAKLRSYRFKAMGKTQLHTALGPLTTVIVERQGKHSHQSKFWLAQDKNYLLVRYKQLSHDNTYVDIRIASLTAN